MTEVANVCQSVHPSHSFGHWISGTSWKFFKCGTAFHLDHLDKGGPFVLPIQWTFVHIVITQELILK